MLKQREWVIFIRPYYQNSGGNNIYYKGTPKADKRDFGEKSSSNDIVDLKGIAEGMEIGNSMPINEGGWVMWYKTTSFTKLREKYKECLTLVGKEMTTVVEIIPIDTMVTPIS